MHIVPVIDVRHGIAVRAVAGDRANYQPLQSRLAATSDPLAVARGLLALFPFDAVYVADLDGIEGRGRNQVLAARLCDALSNVTPWVDDGTAGDDASLRQVQKRVVVVGSESLVGRSTGVPEGSFVLSLDFRGEAFLGPPELLATPELWPERVIVMTLGRVGTGSGPDLGRIADLARRAGGRRVYAAGGVRHINDLKEARRAGAAGALISSALHAGTIKAGDLERAASL